MADEALAMEGNAAGCSQQCCLAEAGREKVQCKTAVRAGGQEARHTGMKGQAGECSVEGWAGKIAGQQAGRCCTKLGHH